MTGWGQVIAGMKAVGDGLFAKVSSDQNRTIVLAMYDGCLVILKLWEQWRVAEEVQQVQAEVEAGLAPWAGGSGGAVAPASVTVLPDLSVLSSSAYAGKDLEWAFKRAHERGDQHALERFGKRCLAAVLLQLETIHTQGCLHRDLKAENILVNTSTGSIHIADFGLMVPFGHTGGACFSGTAPHKDFGLLEGGVFGSTPEAIAALHTPALDVRLIAFTVAAGVLGDKLPDVINIHKTRYITDHDDFLQAVANTDFTTLLHTHLADQQLAHILSCILQPNSQADVPSVQALLQIPELAELAAQDKLLQDKGRDSMQAAHQAAYLAGLEVSALLKQLHHETHSSSGSSADSISSNQPVSSGSGHRITLLQDRFAAANLGVSTLPPAAQAGCQTAAAAVYGPSGCGFNRSNLETAMYHIQWLQLWQQQSQEQGSDADSVQQSMDTSSSMPPSDAGSTPHASDSGDSSPETPSGPMTPAATGSFSGWTPQWCADAFAGAHRAAELEQQLLAAAGAATSAAPTANSMRGWVPQWRPDAFAAAHRAAELEVQLLAAAGAAADSQELQGWYGAVTSADAVLAAADLEAQLFEAAGAGAAGWSMRSGPCLPPNAWSCAELEKQLLASASVSC